MSILCLDIRTLMIVLTLILMVLALALYFVWHSQKEFKPARNWAIGSFLTATGFLLAGLRGIAPLWLSAIIGNILAVAGYLLVDGGIAMAAGFFPPWRLGIIIVTLFGVGVFWFSIITPGFLYRLIIFSATMISMDAYAVYTCFRSRVPYSRKTFRISGPILKTRRGFSGMQGSLRPMNTVVPIWNCCKTRLNL